MKYSFIGFWDGFNGNENFLISPVKNEIKNLQYIDDPYTEECDVLFINKYITPGNNIIGHPILVQYSGEPDINTNYKYDFLISHEIGMPNSIYLPYFLLTGWYLTSLYHKREEITLSEICERKFASFVASHNDLNNIRYKTVKLLNKINTIDCGGSYLNNIGYNVENKHEFIKNYNFNLALENTKKEYYITEKIIDAFYCRTVPIYYGSYNFINNFINPKSYINISNMSDTDIYETIKYLYENNNLLVDILNQQIITNKDFIENIRINCYKQIINIFKNF